MILKKLYIDEIHILIRIFKFNLNIKRVYWENSNGFWVKNEFDSNNNEIYYEDSNGIIDDNRPKK